MGLYLAYVAAYPPEQQNDDLFSLYITYYGEGFTADISDVESRRIEKEGQMIVEYSCPISKYRMQDLSYHNFPSAEELSRRYYNQEKTLEAAELFMQYAEVMPSELVQMTFGFLSRTYAPLPVMAKIYGYHPGNIFEVSVFDPSRIPISLTAELQAEQEVASPFSKRLLNIDLITIMPGFQKKDAIYHAILSDLEPANNVWDKILLFAGGYRDNAAEVNDLFQALQRYPGVLNMKLFSGINGDLYLAAASYFNNNNPDSALISLQESVIFNGLTREKTALAAAIFRLQGVYEKCLIYTLHNAFYGLDTKFVPGNLYLSLKALGFAGHQELKNYLLTNVHCDPWSMDILKTQ